MKITKYGSFTQVTILPVIFPINCYVFEEENERTLIDAGRKKDVKKLITFLQKSEKPLTTIVITHGHSDHVGDIQALKDAFPEAVVYFSQIEEELINSDAKGNLWALSCKPDFLVNEGDLIGSLQVLSSPGHTPGSISLYHSSSKTFIVGDLIQTKGRIAIAGEKVWQFPFMAMGTWDHGQAVTSVKGLATYPTNQIFCGHGDSINSWKHFERSM